MSYGMDKLKIYVLQNREEKQNEEIEQLNIKLTPVEDPEI